MTFVIDSSSLNSSIPMMRNLRLICQPKGADRMFLFDLGFRYRDDGERVFCKVIIRTG